MNRAPLWLILTLPLLTAIVGSALLLFLVQHQNALARKSAVQDLQRVADTVALLLAEDARLLELTGDQQHQV